MSGLIQELWKPIAFPMKNYQPWKTLGEIPSFPPRQLRKPLSTRTLRQKEGPFGHTRILRQWEWQWAFGNCLGNTFKAPNNVSEWKTWGPLLLENIIVCLENMRKTVWKCLRKLADGNPQKCVGWATAKIWYWKPQNWCFHFTIEHMRWIHCHSIFSILFRNYYILLYTWGACSCESRPQVARPEYWNNLFLGPKKILPNDSSSKHQRHKPPGVTFLYGKK